MKQLRAVAAMLALALLLPLAGCIGRRESALSGSGRRGEQVTVEVENQNFYDATIYAIGDGSRSRLGTVVGNTKQNFRLPWIPRDIRFEIRLQAGGTYTTHSLPVNPGDQLQLVVTPDLQLSSVRR
ncbi:MAG: hypothetical protein HY704_10725 [Gemmatimonadetes bacterium]|nr:hypothetical protein [Gemmatimonadota bacterium]